LVLQRRIRAQHERHAPRNDRRRFPMKKFLIGVLFAMGLGVFGITNALAAPAVPSRHAFAPHSLEWDAFYFDRYADSAPVNPQGQDPERELMRGCHAKDSAEPDVSGDL
jgi:hypothetical protein